MTIKEVSLKYGLSQDTLRYYERIGLLPHVPRNRNGIREYDDDSCNWIEFIKCMRGAGLPIEMLIEYVALFQEGDVTLEPRMALLREQRELLAERLLEMQATLQRLDNKIEHYQSIRKIEKGLKIGDSKHE